ncbi:MAG: dihydropteroate synthase [Candidatus Cloacimonetes bacterium]|nr:dihydropteroate synthase [Candidatus Cloacimonadota bacterium]
MNRILVINDEKAAARELLKINVSSGGIESMAPKMNGICLKLENVRLPAANILKQEMLSLGGDAAVARGVVNGEVPVSDVILMGNAMKLQRLAGKLGYQQYFGLPQIRQDILRLLANFQGEKICEMNLNGRKLALKSTRLMGILNVTPDSFSDGNKYFEPQTAIRRGLEMSAEGAAIIDIGGESTRPGAESVSIEEELARVLPVIKGIRAESDVFISIDTQKAAVAQQAISVGADLVNDISALRSDEKMLEVLQEFPATGIILMHMQGTPQTMQQNPFYNDTIREITDFLAERIACCEAKGIERSRIIIDPGIGFGKRQEDNLLILQRLREFHSLDCAVMLAASRKSFLSRIYDAKADEREAGTLAVTAQAAMNGIHLVRVHEIKNNYQLLATLAAVKEQK